MDWVRGVIFSCDGVQQPSSPGGVMQVHLHFVERKILEVLPLVEEPGQEFRTLIAQMALANVSGFAWVSTSNVRKHLKSLVLRGFLTSEKRKGVFYWRMVHADKIRNFLHPYLRDADRVRFAVGRHNIGFNVAPGGKERVSLSFTFEDLNRLADLLETRLK
jgi:hypothetical protein